MSSPHVVVVGSINMDVTVHAERLPGPGETVTGGTALRGGGGKGANAAVAAARAGAAVRLIAAVGEDEPGATAREELWAEGIDVGAVAALPAVATGMALIVVDAAGDNQIAVASGANHALEAAHVATALDDGFLAGACALISFEVPDAPAIAAAQRAAAAGAPIVVNPAPARALPEALLAARPILTPNQHEAAALTGEGDAERAAGVLAGLTRAPVVVTLGERGALVLDPDPGPAAPHVTRHAAPAVDAVDATGAGDVFNGVLAAGLAGGAALTDAVDAAVSAAAASVTRPGAR